MGAQRVKGSSEHRDPIKEMTGDRFDERQVPDTSETDHLAKELLKKFGEIVRQQTKDIAKRG